MRARVLKNYSVGGVTRAVERPLVREWNSLSAMAMSEGGASDAPARIDPSSYFESSIYIAELKGIFSKTWLPVGRVEELPDLGSYFTWERTRIPTVIVRSVDRQIRGFYNSCRHRGAPVVRTPTGRGRAFRCQYHSWTYDTFGKLVGLPDERDFGNFSRCAYSLVPLQIAEFGGWVWIDQSGAASPLATVLDLGDASMAAMEQHGFSARKTFKVRSNWKAVIERLGAGDSAMEAVGGIHWCLPNSLFAVASTRSVLLAAWPLNERETEIELVLAAAPEDAGISLDSLHSDLLPLLDNIAGSGTEISGDNQQAEQLAALWSHHMGPVAQAADAI